MICDLPIHAAHDCHKIFQVSNYVREGYMLLPRFPDADKSLQRDFITKWSNLLRNGAVEKLFNEKYNEFTEERRQFRPLLNPEYTNQACSSDVTEPLQLFSRHIHFIISQSSELKILYPSVLYSYSNGTV